MSTPTPRELNHLDQINAYGSRFERIRILVDWLAHKIIEDYANHTDLCGGITFLEDEIEAANAEQRELLDAGLELDRQGGKQ